MYQALYRKWRPLVFEDVLSQEHITGTVKNQILNNKLSHAYLFSGTRGTGKTSTAKILARAVNCTSPVNANPCNECHACKTSLDGSAVDIIEIDAASNNKVDDVRIIRDEVIYTPAEFKYKVYIIDEAHMLTNQAFNALLKTLEEPPPHIIFIFATTEPHKFPPTILSRCQRFDFKRITPYDTEKRIKQIVENDGYTISDDAIAVLARLADGSMRDALSILDQCLSSGKTSIEYADIAEITGISDPAFIYGFAEKLINCDLSASFGAIKDAYESGRDLERILEDLTLHFRNVLITKTLDDDDAAKEILLVSSGAYKIYREQAEKLSVDRILRYIDILSDAGLSQKYSKNPRLCAEIAVTGIVKKPSLGDIDGLSERISELENRLNNFKAPKSADFEQKKYEPEKIEKIEKIEETEKPVLDIPVFDNYVPPEPDEYEETPESGESVEILENAPTEPNTEEEQGENGDIAAKWNEIMSEAARNADFGFKKMISSAKLDFSSENAIHIIFENNSFLSISKINKYDEIIKKAVFKLFNKDFSIRILSASSGEEKKENNFEHLLKKLDEMENAEQIKYF